jgi:uncharacterized protein
MGSIFERIQTLTITSQLRRDISGLRTPFATRWSPALLLGPLLCILYFYWPINWAINLLLFALFDNPVTSLYRTLLFFGPALIFFVAMFLMQKQFFFPDISFVGTHNRRWAVIGCIAVTAVYLVAYVVAYFLGQPRELYMVNLYAYQTPIQSVLLIFTLLLLPPIVEELVFRHFLLSTLPFNSKNVWISWIAVLATALIFVRAHSYIYWTSNSLIFALGLIFGFARVLSRGLLLPTLLHTYAIALGLACNQIAACLES